MGGSVLIVQYHGVSGKRGGGFTSSVPQSVAGLGEVPHMVTCIAEAHAPRLRSKLDLLLRDHDRTGVP